MTTPSKLSGVATTVEIDDTDLHTMGMIVNTIHNPLPQAVEASARIPLRDGDYDFTRSMGTRVMTLSGSIIANSQSDLNTNVDALTAFFRTRDDGRSFKVEFGNQTDRYWTCRYVSLVIKRNGLWMYGHTASFSLVLKCVKPYSEKTSLTTITEMLNSYKPRKINYAGSCPAPVVCSITSRQNVNLLDQAVSADASETDVPWTEDNCTASAVTSEPDGSEPYEGTYEIKATQTSAGAYYIEIDVTSVIVLTKNYSFQAVIKPYISNAVRLQVINNGAGGNEEVSVTGNAHKHAKIIVTSADLVGTTSIKFRIYNDGSDAYFHADAMAIFEITAAEAADSSFIPPPHSSNPGGSHYVDAVNPNLILLNNTNMLCDGLGDSILDWHDSADMTAVTTKLIVVDDPFEPGKKCLLYLKPSTGSAEYIYSGPIPVPQGKVLTVSLKYHVEAVAGTGNPLIYGIFLHEQLDSSIAGATPDRVTILDASAVTSAWTSATAQVENVKGRPFARIQIYAGTAAVSKIYIKEVLMTISDSVDGVYPAFKKAQYRNIAYTGSLNLYDDLRIDSDKFSAQLSDHSARTAANALANIVGDPLILVPGTNWLVYRDKRQTYWYSGVPDLQGPGCANAVISYRERYW